MITPFTFCLFWLFLVLIVYFLPGRSLRGFFSSVPPLMVLTAALTIGLSSSPDQKMLLTFPALLYALKASLLLHKYTHEELALFSKTGLLIYMTVWPGLDVRPFKQRTSEGEIDKVRFARGYIIMWSGALMCVATTLLQHIIPSPLNTIAGLISLLVMMHLGYTDVLVSLLRWRGWKVGLLFNEPWKSTSLRDFWSRRWNLAFVEMNRELFLPMLKTFSGTRTSVFLAFLISGVLHELTITYPSNGAPGGPFAYFLIQAIGCLFESRLFPKGSGATKTTTNAILKRIFVWTVILLPLPILFTHSFLQSIIGALFENANALTSHLTPSLVLDKVIWFAAFGNFLTMVAGLQAPARLNWKEEFARLSNFNRKIFLNYYFYIGGLVGSWGLLTVSLHDDFLRGNHIAGMLASLITVFWGARLVVDAFYFKHSDWPSGSELVIGHALLNTLFVFLTASYAALAVWCSINGL